MWIGKEVYINDKSGDKRWEGLEMARKHTDQENLEMSSGDICEWLGGGGALRWRHDRSVTQSKCANGAELGEVPRKRAGQRES